LAAESEFAAAAALRELPVADFSFIYETGQREMDEKGVPETYTNTPLSAAVTAFGHQMTKYHRHCQLQYCARPGEVWRSAPGSRRYQAVDK
jgi:hypothetical protein